MPAFLAAVPALSKALGFAQGLTKLGTAVGASAPAIKGMLAGQGARAAITRMAGPTLASYGGKMIGGIAQAVPRNMSDAAMMIGPDVLFGGIAGAMTPGDMGDKLIAGSTATLGGALGGIGMRGAIGGIAPKTLANTPALQMGAELIGGMGGDMAAQGVADGLLRMKGGGTTPYEKMAAQQQKELEQQILRSYLSGKGGYPSADPTLVANGLG